LKDQTVNGAAQPMNSDLFVRTAGAGSPVLILLHGLGMNGSVWEPFRAHLAGWPGRIVIPDLRGHGRSPHASAYSTAAQAADVAALMQGEHGVHVIGHSMGGMIALALTDGSHAVDVKAVFAFGLKVVWNDRELAKLAEVARKPARWFPTREKACARFLSTTGLTGLVSAGAPVVDAGIVQDAGGWRLAADPRAGLVVSASAAPHGGNVGAFAAAVWRASTVPRWLACGNRDALVTLDELRALDPEAIALGDVGHNVHVEDPAALFAAVPFLQGSKDRA
jgi:pimeloyl-ACP methyl ester carboxylesterase